MKTIYLLILLVFTNAYSNELQWVDEQIQAIKPPRAGIAVTEVQTLQNPFQKYTAQTLKTKVVKLNKTKPLKGAVASQKTNAAATFARPSGLNISTIINKAARINNKWYKQNDKVGRYKLIEVNKHDVILSYNGNKYLLSLLTKNKKIKINK